MINPSPFQWDYFLQLISMIDYPLCLKSFFGSSSLSNYCPFLCIPSQLNVSKYLFTWLSLFHILSPQNSQIMSLPLHDFTKTSCVKVTVISMLSGSMDNLFFHLTHSLSCIRSRWPLLHHWFSSYLWCLWQFLLSLCYRLSSNV